MKFVQTKLHSKLETTASFYIFCKIPKKMNASGLRFTRIDVYESGNHFEHELRIKEKNECISNEIKIFIF